MLLLPQAVYTSLCQWIIVFVAGITEGPREGPAQRLVAERRWRLAMQSQAHPSSIMRNVLACLQLNQVSWKKQAPYNLKCRKAIGLAGTQCCMPSRLT